MRLKNDPQSMRQVPPDRTRRPRRALLCAATALLAVVVALIGAVAANANGVPFSKGDVLADVGGGVIRHFSATGTLLDTLNTTTGTAEGDGMCFGSEGDLYATQGFVANTMSKFDGDGELLVANFGEGFNEHPESCVFDSANDMFVGQPDGEKKVLELDTSGKLLASFSPEVEDRGTDWVDLSSDQCTLHYTSEGSAVKAFNVCKDEQLPAFATGLPASPCYAHRILPDGGELVACTSEVVRLNSEGKVTQTYEPEPSGFLFALNLDPDGKTFWTAGYLTGEIYHINIETGAVETSFSAGSVSPLGGVVVVGECTSSESQIKLSPPSAEKEVKTSYTATATVKEECGTPVSGAKVTFTVAGVNPKTEEATTNGSGEATLTYTGENAGTDTVTGSFVNKKKETETSNEATVTWTEPIEKRPTTLTTKLSGGGKSGSSISVQEGTAVADNGTLTGNNASAATGTVTYNVYSDPACTSLVTTTGSVSVSGESVPASEAQTLPAGTYYWQAAYSGDAKNEESQSACGSEIETVTAKCNAISGEGVFGTGGERQTLTDSMTTNLAGPEHLKLTWDKGKILTLVKLQTAKCLVQPNNRVFRGTGTAKDGPEGIVQVAFVISVSNKGVLNVQLRITAKGHVVLAHFADLAKTTEVIS